MQPSHGTHIVGAGPQVIGTDLVTGETSLVIKESDDWKRPTLTEIQMDPGWKKIEDIRQGSRLPHWNYETRDFNRAWTQADYDLAHQLIINVGLELAEHDEIKAGVRAWRQD